MQSAVSVVFENIPVSHRQGRKAFAYRMPYSTLQYACFNSFFSSYLDLKDRRTFSRSGTDDMLFHGNQGGTKAYVSIVSDDFVDIGTGGIDTGLTAVSQYAWGDAAPLDPTIYYDFWNTGENI